MSEDLGSEDLNLARKRGGVKLPVPFGCLFIVLMPLAAAISIPWGLVHNWLQKRRERVFREDLRARGRLMEWDDFKRKMEGHEGTLIAEWYSLKGPVRVWWTSEKVREVSPHPVGDWIGSGGKNFIVPFSYWCRERYTDRENGTAFLVDSSSATKESTKGFRSRLMSEETDPYCVRATPPEALPKRLRRAQAD